MNDINAHCITSCRKNAHVIFFFIIIILIISSSSSSSSSSFTVTIPLLIRLLLPRPLFHLLVFIRKLLGLADHLLDLLLCQAALVVGDGNLFLGAAQRSPVTCGMRGIFCHQKLVIGESSWWFWITPNQPMSKKNECLWDCNHTLFSSFFHWF